jgi:hypothetical protein
VGTRDDLTFVKKNITHDEIRTPDVEPVGIAIPTELSPLLTPSAFLLQILPIIRLHLHSPHIPLLRHNVTKGHRCPDIRQWVRLADFKRLVADGDWQWGGMIFT